MLDRSRIGTVQASVVYTGLSWRSESLKHSFPCVNHVRITVLTWSMIPGLRVTPWGQGQVDSCLTACSFYGLLGLASGLVYFPGFSVFFRSHSVWRPIRGNIFFHSVMPQTTKIARERRCMIFPRPVYLGLSDL